MSLTEQVDIPRKPTVHGKICSLAALWLAITPAEREAMDALLYNLDLTASEVLFRIRKAGHDVSHQQINRHRTGKCSCRKYFGEEMYQAVAA